MPEGLAAQTLSVTPPLAPLSKDPEQKEES